MCIFQESIKSGIHHLSSFFVSGIKIVTVMIVKMNSLLALLHFFTYHVPKFCYLKSGISHLLVLYVIVCGLMEFGYFVSEPASKGLNVRYVRLENYVVYYDIIWQ